MPHLNLVCSENEDFTTQEMAQSVIIRQSEAVLDLFSSIDATFDEVIECMLLSKGHLIVSGMGKSGHIARKIAATFASTGQPAFFIHPAEAGHGDLGMITQDDVLLLISCSGETTEILPLLDYAHRFQIKVISITKNPISTLARLSTHCLLLPPFEEACPLNLAPTTSTTLTLVLGDTLAITLLRKRGFSDSDFRQFHPKGNLGAQLQQVQDIMHPRDVIPLVLEKTSMKEAIVCMSKQGFGCVGVCDSSGDTLLGIITDGDLRRHMDNNLLQKQVEDVMTVSPLTIQSTHLVSDVLATMQTHQITSLFVIDFKGKIVGLIHIHDCLKIKAL